MNALPDFVLEEIRRRRESRGPLWNGAVLTSLFVAAGFTVASMTLTPVPTFANVASAYAEARYDRDWAAAWELLCRQTRAQFGGYERYVEQSEYVAEYLFLPRDVDVSVGSSREVELPGVSGHSVTLTVTSDEREGWEMSGPVLVVAEEGDLRVCAPGLGEG